MVELRTVVNIEDAKHIMASIDSVIQALESAIVSYSEDLHDRTLIRVSFRHATELDRFIYRMSEKGVCPTKWVQL